MVVKEAGKAIVYSPGYDPILHRRFYDRITFADLRALYLNRYVAIGKDKNGKPITALAADWWLRHPRRRQLIEGVVFDPTGREKPGVLNLWQGFAVVPRPGSWTRMREHIRQIICADNQEHFAYLIGWMARLVQHPAEQGEVAVVMRGGHPHSSLAYQAPREYIRASSQPAACPV